MASNIETFTAVYEITRIRKFGCLCRGNSNVVLMLLDSRKSKAQTVRVSDSSSYKFTANLQVRVFS